MDILIETGLFRLTVGSDAIVKSLTLKADGEELLRAGEELSLFSVTQTRPFHNEIKLAHPNKRTTWQANRLTREGDTLLVGFEVVPVKARIRLTEAERFAAFTLEGFDNTPEDYGGLAMDVPPVEELRLCQLPLRHRKCFGEWLNVVWDEKAAVNVLAASPEVRIESEKRKDCRILTADAVRGLRLIGAACGLIAAPPEELLDAIDDFERAFGLPRGAKSRRSELINASVYWTMDLTPENVDEHVARAKQGGFRLMLLYYRCFVRAEGGWALNGNYDWNDAFPRGEADVRAVLDRIKAAGILPGLHFLHTHVGLKSRYVTPNCDPRLGLVRHFTLSGPLGETETELFVEQDPTGSVMADGRRLLNFGGELIRYAGYTTERPFRFTGCERGACATRVRSHPAGQIGGILDVSEFGGSSCYVDQTTSLQGEIADKIARIYNCGFRFCYMDGSEGTSLPYECYVPQAQMTVYERLKEKPIFTEGAAKAHFSWHSQAGGNAFDVFPPEIFKEMIDRWPADEAPRMRQDFTRLDFGWWGFWAPDETSDGTQADQYEYGTARAAAWDCPATVQAKTEVFRAHPRTEDILEVMRRWEELRAAGLPEAWRERLRRAGVEHTLLRRGEGFCLAEVRRVKTASPLTAYTFELDGRGCAVYWHTRGEGTLRLPLGAEAVRLTDESGETVFPVEEKDGALLLPMGDKRYLRSELSAEELAAAIERAEVL